jgi:NTE family protein
MGLLDVLRRRRRPGLALALGGGGARGVAHFGVLLALEEAGIPVVSVVGTSAGAVVGAMWLAYGSAAAAEARWREFLRSGLLPDSLPNTRLTDNVSSRDNLLLSFARRVQAGASFAFAVALERPSLIEREEFDRAIAFLLPEVAIESLRLPFAAVATDFGSGLPIALRQGPLRLAVAASSAIPGVIPPYSWRGRALIDGGVVADVPAAQARLLGAAPVLAVDIGETLPPADALRTSVPGALMRAGIMTHQALRDFIVREADLVLRPDVGRIHWSEFDRSAEAIEAGRAAALGLLGAIRRVAGEQRS